MSATPTTCMCLNTCVGGPPMSLNNTVCDDGGASSQYSWCEFGTDCLDCGPRCQVFPPSAPPSPPSPPLLPSTDAQCGCGPIAPTCTSGGVSMDYALRPGEAPMMKGGIITQEYRDKFQNADAAGKDAKKK